MEELLMREYIGKDVNEFLDPISDNTNVVQDEVITNVEANQSQPKKKDKTVNVTAGILGAFFGPVWFFYRKSYLIGFGFFALTIIIGIIVPGGKSVGNALSTLMGFLYAFTANKLYLWDVRRKVNKIISKNQYLSNDELVAIARKKGGTSVVAVVMYSILLILYILAIIFLYFILAYLYAYANQTM